MLSELGNGDVLNGDAIVGIGRDHRVALPVVVRGGQRRLEIRKHGVIDCNDVGVAMEICDGLVAEIRHENEGIASIGTGCRGASQRRALECELVVRAALPPSAAVTVEAKSPDVEPAAATLAAPASTAGGSWKVVPVPDESWSKSHPEWV